MATMTQNALKDVKNDIPEETRSRMVEVLQARLADAIDVQLQAKQAHWNVKGPSFQALHELFDDANGQLSELSDEIAERLVQLGGVAEGTSQAVAGRTSLPGYPLEIQAGTDHVEAFSSALAAYGKNIRAAIDAADEAGDKDTADLFTEVSRGVDKLLWFVESHNMESR